MRLSIRYKILAVWGVLLIGAVALYTLLASAVFKEQKTALLYDINHSLATNAASQIRSTLMRVGDSLRVYTLAQVLSEKSALRLPQDFLKKQNLNRVRLFEWRANQFQEWNRTPPVAAEAILQPRLAEAMQSNFAFWLEERTGQTALRLATKIDLTSGTETRNFIVTADIDGKPLFETLQASNLFTSYLIRQDGFVLMRAERDRLVAPSPIANHPLLAKIREKKLTSSGVDTFSLDDKEWYGAYAPVGIGDLSFISQAETTEVTEALKVLVKRSLHFGLIVITATFLISILFARRLTGNLAVLSESAQRIEKGDLSTSIKVRSKDEVGELAQAFNTMASALKASREAIEKYNAELEQKVELRTKQLQESVATIKEVQETLVQKTQMAAIGELAGRTAHEVLNPLTAILSRVEHSRSQVTVSQRLLNMNLVDILTAWEGAFAAGGVDKLIENLNTPSSVQPNQSLLEEDLQNLKKITDGWAAQQRATSDDLQFVQDQAERIHRIVDQMRQLVRSSEKADVHCHDAVREAVMTSRDFLAKHNIQLQQELNASWDLASLNRDELIQILSNLIRNSFQAIVQDSDAEKRTGKIVVKTSNTADTLWVDVWDSGPGIAPENIPKLFDQGFTTKAPDQGTGLGLSICRRYARAFGGEVELVSSEPVLGTCFRVRVPLKNSPELKLAI